MIFRRTAAGVAATATLTGLRTLTITPISVLHVTVLSRQRGLTPMAEALLEVARAYTADVLSQR